MKKLLPALLLVVGFLPQAHALYEVPDFPQDDEPATREQLVTSLADYFDLPVTEEVALGMEYNIMHFSDILPTDPLYPVTTSLCVRNVLDCGTSKTFRPNDAASIESALKLFYEIQYWDQGTGYIPKKYGNPAGEWSLPYTVEAVREGMVAKEKATGTLTHKGLQMLFFKDSVRRFYKREIAFFDGLVVETGNITTKQYQQLSRLEAILASYDRAQSGKLSPEVVQQLNTAEAAFRNVYEEIKAAPLQHDAAFSDTWKATFREAGIKERIGQGSYRFKTNEAYRKQNIKGTLEKMNGLVLQPGEEFNYWEVLNKIGKEHIVSGWTLQGSNAVWAWGGGLCGSATALFRAAWFSGLEITDRRPHSVYTTGYYPMKDIGLDASIFMPAPNFKFRNDTGAPLMLYVTYKEEPGYGTVTIDILGTKNYKNITFPELKKNKGTYIRERVLQFLDGTERTDQIKSSYRSIK